MKLKEFGVQLGSLVQEFGLEVVYAPENFEKIEITKDDVNRPALQLAGYFDYFDPSRLQIIGKVETTYVGQFTPEQRLAAFEKLFSTGIPALIIPAISIFTPNAWKPRKNTISRFSVPMNLPQPS